MSQLRAQRRQAPDERDLRADDLRREYGPLCDPGLGLLQDCCRTGWLERYLGSIKDKGFECDVVYERECFKFGAANRIYESTYAAIVMMNVLGKWIGVKAAVIHGELPLLMSRPAWHTLVLSSTWG